jgi:hypothetical protein
MLVSVCVMSCAGDDGVVDDDDMSAAGCCVSSSVSRCASSNSVYMLNDTSLCSW